MLELKGKEKEEATNSDTHSLKGTKGESEFGTHLYILSHGGKGWPRLSESQRVSFFSAEAWVAVRVSWGKKETSRRTQAVDWKGNYSLTQPFF